jgi:hypothetical protein
MTLDPDPLTVPDDDPDAPSNRRGCLVSLVVALVVWWLL